jgi:hypothetical protein
MAPRIALLAALVAGLLTAVPHPAGAATTPPPALGYWLVASDGGVFGFGGAPFEGSLGRMSLPSPITSVASTPTGRGYWMVSRNGSVYAFGDAPFHGAAPGASPVVAIAGTPDGNGYWVATRSGAVYPFGDAPSVQAVVSPAPIVGMTPTADGQGLWLVSANGGVYSLGDAPFYGSAGNVHLVKPIVGMAATPDGGGYWLVASDGGIFAYGDAPFYGSTGAIRLNQPIVGMAPAQGGYWLVASDGGIFAYGNAPFRGSTGGIHLNQPIVGMAGSSAADPYPVGAVGNDISFPQCGRSLPPAAPFGIVGVNNGRAFTPNACLSDEAAWAGPGVSAYMNLNAPTTTTGDPGFGEGLHGPAGNCAATDAACIASNFGYNAAVDAFEYASSQGVHAGVWWLDIETANTWSSSPGLNALTIQGALVALNAEGVIAGVYSTSFQWGKIAGTYSPQVPLWVATGADAPTAQQFCSPDHAFGGGVIWLTQFGTQGDPFDQDYACPVG